MTSVEEIAQKRRALRSSAATGWERSGDWSGKNSGGLGEWLAAPSAA